MSEEALAYIAETMESLSIPYDFVVWNGEKVPDPYFVGEYAEEEPADESGEQDSTFMITGTTRGSWLSLEQVKTKLRKAFPKSTGKTVILPSGAGLAVFYSDSFPVPSDEGDYKRIQINLKIKEWSVE